MVGKKENEIIHSLLDLLLNYWLREDEVCYYFFFQIIINQLFQFPKYKNFNCKIKDDTVPHLLIVKLFDEFDLEQYDFIKNLTSIHKLTLAINKESNKFTYYDHLKENYL